VRIEKSGFNAYNAYLAEPSRPPSQGGNTRALHRHVIIIGGDKYSFFAPWSGKFAHKGELISFDWDWDRTGTFRNIDTGSFEAFTRDGVRQVRGDRGDKNRRSASARPPGRRSEWGD
jgi:hypothetical protein